MCWWSLLSLLLLLPPLASASRVGGPPPTLDDLWASTAHFAPIVTLPINSANFTEVDAGTRIVVVNSTWYLFGRYDTGPTPTCAQGMIRINVRASTTKGRSWGPASPVATPDGQTTCIFADGSAFYDSATATWHYLVQVLNAGAVGGWMLSHFTLPGPSPFGAWAPNPHNPVVRGGDLFNRICAGVGKHCAPGMVDEGTPEIVEKVGGEFLVTFHGYDYGRKQAARGVARTPDFVTWEVTGGPLPGDVLFSSLDCEHWDVPWAAPGGCIGSGEASILRTRGGGTGSGYLYQVIEAADRELGCETGWDTQWWPLGMVRSPTWAASPQWQQMQVTPFVGGPGGGEPRVGCSIQYNSLHWEGEVGGAGGGTTYLAFWDVSFHPTNASSPSQSWHLYELVWGMGGGLPMAWPGPPQGPPPPTNCSTQSACKATCPGFTQCPSDGFFYCCADTTHCAATHDCAGAPGLHFCSCGNGSGGGSWRGG